MWGDTGRVEVAKRGVSPILRIHEKTYFSQNFSDMIFFAKFKIYDRFHALLHRKKLIVSILQLAEFSAGH